MLEALVGALRRREVDAWTGFASAFTHTKEARAYLENLATSVIAVLTAEATNVGLVPVVSASDPTLTRSRLSYVAHQNPIAKFSA